MYIDDNLKGRSNNFDIIRLIAGILVIFSHTYPLYLGSESNEPLMMISRGKMTLGGLQLRYFLS